MSCASPTMLIILDGLGISCEEKNNAFFQAKTPYLDRWKFQHFYTTLQASGTFVGLQDGDCGNSQVGHFTIGAGKIIPQTATLLNEYLACNQLYTNTTLTDCLQNFNTSKRIHLLGLTSDGNIHSNIQHARAFIKALARHGIKNIAVHAFLDGRDTPPQSALHYLDTIQADLQELSCGSIASIHGRYYAMDRDNNWDRTEKSFDILTNPQTTIISYEDHLNNQYNQMIFDEYVLPTACIENHTIQAGDGIIFFNFRPDRAIQLTQKLLQLPCSFFITPVSYHKNLATTPLVKSIQTEKSLLEILAENKKTIFTIAETEKYAHVTYFFNGHKDIVIETEKRILIPSLKIKPELAPAMQAKKITQAILESIDHDPKDFYLINYANADMVGHSGNLKATITAIECLDLQLGQLYEKVVVEKQGTIYITADHGNAEKMFDQQHNQPCTSHTSNPVPFYMLTNQKKQIDYTLQGLADIAQLIIKNMQINL